MTIAVRAEDTLLQYTVKVLQRLDGKLYPRNRCVCPVVTADNDVTEHGLFGSRTHA
jgi:hypothetical protein